MPTLKIDEQEYELDTLSPEAKAQLNMLQLTEQEIQRLQARMAIAQTARTAYLKALKQLLPDTSAVPPGLDGETIRFN